MEKEDIDNSLSKNVSIDLMEKISRELNVTNCCICGSTQMADVWPWEGTSLAPLDILRWKQMKQEPARDKIRRKEQWDLKSKVLGKECIRRTG
ncbi:ENR1 protein, partial [Cisticola juncidis]|nr:ENR1 protein [Cisticola juncidis]